MPRLKLSSTSALVLLWLNDECYQSKSAKQFLSLLDLEEGKQLYEQCHQVWPFYGEVIKNRKFGVLKCIEKGCSEETNGQQIVIAGSGLDPLGIEIARRFPQVKIFELDKENMDLKSRLCSDVMGDATQPISFIDCDLSNGSSLAGCLAGHGWDKKKPTITVFEGISYYLSEDALKTVVRTIDPESAVIEYLKKEEKIAADRSEIPRKVFDIIADECAVPHIYRYRHSWFEKIFKATVVDRYGMRKLEMMRTGINRFFPTDESGWIEVCRLKKNYFS